MKIFRKITDPTRHLVSESDREVRFFEFSKAIFVWPLIPLTIILQLLYLAGVSPEVLAWIHFSIIAFVLLTVTVDLNRDAILILVLVTAVIILFGMWLSAIGIPGFRWVSTELANLDPKYDPGRGALWGIVGFVLVGYSFAKAIFDGRWCMTPNELQHKVLFKRTRAVARGAKTVDTEFEDALEWIVGFGAGTLIVYDARSRRILNRIQHVIGLSSKIRRMNRILELREHVEGHYGDHDDGYDDEEVDD